MGGSCIYLRKKEAVRQKKEIIVCDFFICVRCEKLFRGGIFVCASS